MAARALSWPAGIRRAASRSARVVENVGRLLDPVGDLGEVLRFESQVLGAGQCPLFHSILPSLATNWPQMMIDYLSQQVLDYLSKGVQYAVVWRSMVNLMTLCLIFILILIYYQWGCSK